MNVGVMNVVGEAGNMVCRMAGLDSSSTPLAGCVTWDKQLHLSEPSFFAAISPKVAKRATALWFPAPRPPLVLVTHNAAHDGYIS